MVLTKRPAVECLFPLKEESYQVLTVSQDNSAAFARLCLRSCYTSGCLVISDVIIAKCLCLGIGVIWEWMLWWCTSAKSKNKKPNKLSGSVTKCCLKKNYGLSLSKLGEGKETWRWASGKVRGNCIDIFLLNIIYIYIYYICTHIKRL